MDRKATAGRAALLAEILEDLVLPEKARADLEAMLVPAPGPVVRVERLDRRSELPPYASSEPRWVDRPEAVAEIRNSLDARKRLGVIWV